MLPRIIALYSPCMHSGKSTVSQVLTTECGYMNTKFAGPLKDMVASFLYNFGLDPDDVESCLEGRLKELEITRELPGVTPRRLMQTLGYEWGQKCVSSDVWVVMARKRLSMILKEGGRSVVDDLRYPQEFQMLKELGAQFWHISRPGAQDSTGHHSEGLLNDHEWDVRIVNKDGLDELKQSVRDLLSCFV